MIKHTPFSEIISQIESGLAEHGLTAADLCREANIAQTTWGRWKGGKFDPRDGTRQSVIAAYNTLIARETSGAGERQSA